DKDGLKDLRKAQHAIAKYIEVVENEQGQLAAQTAEPLPRFKEPAEWTKAEQAAVAESVIKHNPLLGSLSEELNTMNEVLGMNCTCSSQVPAPEGWLHLTECPARNPLAQPTPEERGVQMEWIHKHIDMLTQRMDNVHTHWQGKVNMVSDNEWTYEGGTKDWDEWTCKSCGSHVRTEANYGPPKKCHMHPPEDAAEPTRAYVDQG
ncbi:unnamed protein product, partial [marine sediment metagenome]